MGCRRFKGAGEGSEGENGMYTAVVGWGGWFLGRGWMAEMDEAEGRIFVRWGLLICKTAFSKKGGGRAKVCLCFDCK